MSFPGGILPARRGAKGLGTVPKYPVITGPTSANVDENTTPVATFTADEAVTWSIYGGLDAAKFTISSGGALNFITAPDYENPTDTNADNVYEVVISAVNGEGNRTTQTLLAYVMDVAVEVVPDPDFENVTLLLHGDGSNGAQNNTFIDSSTNNFTITRNGNTTQGSFSPYGSNWSNYFDGNNDGLSVADSAAFNLSGTTYTLEAWIYPTGDRSAYRTIFSKRAGDPTPCAWQLSLNITSGTLIFYNGTLYNSNAVVPLNTWSHVAAVYDGTNINLYLNGTRVLQAAASNIDCAASVQVGYFFSSIQEPFLGYISNARIVKGTQVYTGTSFTVSTASLTAISGTSLLTCQSNRFRDNSINTHAITRNGDVRVTAFSPFAPTVAYNAGDHGGSIYLDGTGDFLGLPSSSQFHIGGDFCVEGWVYLENYSSVSPFFNTCANTVSAGGLGFNIGNNGVINVFDYVNTSAIVVAGTVPLRQWTHIAATRSGTVVRVFVNGVVAGSGDNGQEFSYGNSAQGGIGGWAQNNEGSFRGYISDLRFVNGSAIYTSSFTPPSAPLTAITNTRLLLKGTNAAIFNSSSKTDLETVGNAQVNTSVKKFGTGSMYFDGSGDYLTTPASDLYAFGTGDFTVECWFKSAVSNQTSHATIVACYQSSTNGTWAFKFHATTNNLAFASYSNNSWNDWVTGVNPVSDQAWHHLAVTRSNGTLRIFVDGVLANTWTGITNNLTGAGHPLTIGWMQQDPSTSYINGYIDDLRITKGVARYTANFTPPTLPFSDQ